MAQGLACRNGSGVPVVDLGDYNIRYALRVRMELW